MASLLRSLAQRLRGGDGEAAGGASAGGAAAGPSAAAAEPSALGRALLESYQTAWVRLDRGGARAAGSAARVEAGVRAFEKRAGEAHHAWAQLDTRLSQVDDMRRGVDEACAGLNAACEKLRRLGLVLGELQAARHAAAAAQLRADQERALAAREREALAAVEAEHAERERIRQAALQHEFDRAMDEYRADGGASLGKRAKKAKKRRKKEKRSRSARREAGEAGAAPAAAGAAAAAAADDDVADALAGFFVEDKLHDSSDSEAFEEFLADAAAADNDNDLAGEGKAAADGSNVVVGAGAVRQLSSVEPRGGAALDDADRRELEAAE